MGKNWLFLLMGSTDKTLLTLSLVMVRCHQSYDFNLPPNDSIGFEKKILVTLTDCPCASSARGHPSGIKGEVPALTFDPEREDSNSKMEPSELLSKNTA